MTDFEVIKALKTTYSKFLRLVKLHFSEIWLTRSAKYPLNEACSVPVEYSPLIRLEHPPSYQIVSDARSQPQVVYILLL